MEKSAAASATRRLGPEERERFERLVLPHLDAAHNLARYLVRNADDAEDVVQEAVLRALTYFDGFRGGDARAWLLTIVRRTCYTQLERRQALAQAVEFDEELHVAPAAAADPDAALAERAAADALWRALGGMPLEFREILVLRELEGLSYREIGEVIGVPVGTVMSRLSRARDQLRHALGGSAGEGG